MQLALRHPAPFVLVLSACATLAAVFALADQGIDLYRSKAFSITVFSETPQQFADELQVLVGPRRGHGSWGPKLEPYDERFGNVLVTYGGRDERMLERVKNAVSALRSSGA